MRACETPEERLAAAEATLAECLNALQEFRRFVESGKTRAADSFTSAVYQCGIAHVCTELYFKEAHEAAQKHHVIFTLTK